MAVAGLTVVVVVTVVDAGWEWSPAKSTLGVIYAVGMPVLMLPCVPPEIPAATSPVKVWVWLVLLVLVELLKWAWFSNDELLDTAC